MRTRDHRDTTHPSASRACMGMDWPIRNLMHKESTVLIQLLAGMKGIIETIKDPRDLCVAHKANLSR